MSKKVERAVHGPSWTEIILGIVLSLLLGVVLGAALLMLRPVAIVKEMPKPEDQKAGIVYFLEGTKDSAKAKQAPAKRAAFLKGQTVTVDENEINSLVPTPPPAPAAPPPAKAPAGSPPAKPKGPPPAPMPAAPNFRIRDGLVQIGTPATIGAAGLEQKVFVHGQGTFVKDGDKFIFAPNTLYVGSCPVDRMPFLAGYVRDHLLAAQPVPEDVAAAWGKLGNVTVEGNQLTLAAQ